MGCINVCLETGEQKLWGEAGVGYWPSGSNKVKVWG